MAGGGFGGKLGPRGGPEAPEGVEVVILQRSEEKFKILRGPQK